MDEPPAQRSGGASTVKAKTGVDHLGIRAENEAELQSIRQLLDTTAQPVEA